MCRYGFIVMDGNGSLFGTLSGNTREVLHKFQVSRQAGSDLNGGAEAGMEFAEAGKGRYNWEVRHSLCHGCAQWACRGGRPGIRC
jgi:hypothetical protein